MKTINRSVITLIFVAIFLAACSGVTVAPTTAPSSASAPTNAPAPTTAPAATTAAPASAATAAPNAAKSNVTLTYMASQDWIADAEQDLGKKFEAKTGIHIDYQIIPSDQYFTVLKTKLNAGEATDLVGGQSGVTDLKVNYDVEKNAVDLSGESWAKQEDPLVAAQSTVNGKLYGLTYWDTLGGSWVVNYNKDIFKKYNLSEPKT
jgi:raffinose/stachyose/melibiose transport system substrate-binding protein